LILVPAHTYFEHLNELEDKEQSIVDFVVEKMLTLHKGLEILHTDWEFQELHPNHIQYTIKFKKFTKVLQFLITDCALIVMLYDSV